MAPSTTLFLARVPFIKLLLPFAGGILLSWQASLSVIACITGLFLSGVLVLLFRCVRGYRRLRLQWLQAILVTLLLLCLGMFVAATKDVRRHRDWFPHRYMPGSYFRATLLEQPVEKSRSYKAEADITCLVSSDSLLPVRGRVLIYFRKDTGISRLRAGDPLFFAKEPQQIRNSGNPGAFDYRRYALFNGITHQLYLAPGDFVRGQADRDFNMGRWLYETRSSILGILKKYINGPRELGLAEALLIGYRDDMDKELLQSYSDTGVVHVIAVSGMHLGLVYWLLNLFLEPLRKRKKTRWLHGLIILSVLWMFSLLAGGAASIIRAAVMFTCIQLGKMLNRNASVYNTLAASAFLLLCYNPYWLWDAGFQLSYAAVLSIVIFYKPLYRLITVNNKLLDGVWQLCAVSMAAQVLTTPIAVYQFHQFPVCFLITNLLVVPVSSLVLIGELLLVLLAPCSPLAALAGRALSSMIWWMNGIVENLGRYPFALWKGLLLNIPQVILLYIFISGMAVVWMQKRKAGLWAAAISLSGILIFRTLSFYDAGRQAKMIVYNIPGAGAVDLIRGRDHLLIADPVATADPLVRRNVFLPSLTLHRLQECGKTGNLRDCDRSFVFCGKQIMLVDQPVERINHGGTAAIMILSGNPRLYISQLINRVRPRQIVIDGSVPAWKARYWQRDCDSLRIPCHNVAEKGAFVMNL
ncbi:ComEC/Rec2 family competence protein [Niabella drilacis]|uniref:Competence protein ComEC n=1 Tax=Niabella drilacis (strain DSM 25811 / CCM 8410 / CCUG 62505 / LMG 26954 / E90) TaxID=1285928 RepID=A0A1G6NH66_NIADE|nr:ComEC/Rec2 family competence protein [Niabella drilacis]SDC67192.1 competence protein ComEC [Niabella drilacis]